MKSNHVFFEKLISKNRKKKGKKKQKKKEEETRNKDQHYLLLPCVSFHSQLCWTVFISFTQSGEYWILWHLFFSAIFLPIFPRNVSCISLGALLITTTNCTRVIGKGSWNMKINCEKSWRKVIVTHCSTSQAIAQKKPQKTNKFLVPISQLIPRHFPRG